MGERQQTQGTFEGKSEDGDESLRVRKGPVAEDGFTSVNAR